MEMETEAVPSKPPEQDIFVTVSDALEYLFCPRFKYSSCIAWELLKGKSGTTKS